jgi:chromosome segregation ATPase
MNNINMKGIYKDNEYFDVDELDSNNNISNNNTNTKLSKKNKNSSINTLYQDNKFFNANNEKIDKKVKEETDQNIEFNMTMLTPEGIDKIKLLNEYINQIKENSNKINENKILELQSQKEQLEYNVKYLTNNIILTKKKYNDNVKTEKNLLAEKEKVGFDKKKANKDAFTLQKELPNNRVEIEIMKNRITQTKEETKNINNYYYEIERQTNEIQDEIKKINVKISASIKEKDKIMNEINAIKKKNSIIRNKIYKVENSANEFLFNVGQLAKSTQSIKIK